MVSHALCIRFERRTATQKAEHHDPTRKIGVGAFLLGSIAGGAIGLSGPASAAPTDDSTTATTVVVGDSSTTSDTTDETSSDSGTDTSTDRAQAGPHTANGITEEELTGETAASVEAAVLAAYPDATIDRMETDAEGAAYEAHVTPLRRQSSDDQARRVVRSDGDGDRAGWNGLRAGRPWPRRARRRRRQERRRAADTSSTS